MIFNLSLQPFKKEFDKMRKVLIAILLIVFSDVAFAQNEKIGSPDLPGDLIVNFGINTLRDRPDTMRLRAFGSKSFSVYYARRIQISPRFSFYPAIGISSEKYEFEESITFQRNSEGGIEFDDIPRRFDFNERDDLEKNRLVINYLEVPVEFRFHPWKSTDGSGFFVGVGGSLGVRVSSHMKIKVDGVDDVTGEDFNYTDKFKNNFDLSSVRYGLIGRVGFRGINAFYRVYFSELFDTGKSPDPEANPTSYTIGISINAF